MDHSERWSPTPTKPTKCFGTQAGSFTLIGQDQPTNQNPVPEGSRPMRVEDRTCPRRGDDMGALGRDALQVQPPKTEIFSVFFLQNIFRFNHLMLAVNASINILIYVAKVIMRYFQALLSYITALFLVGSFIVMLRQLSYAIKNQLKAPKAPYLGQFLSVFFYGIRICGFHARNFFFYR